MQYRSVEVPYEKEVMEEVEKRVPVAKVGTRQVTKQVPVVTTHTVHHCETSEGGMRSFILFGPRGHSTHEWDSHEDRVTLVDKVEDETYEYIDYEMQRETVAKQVVEYRTEQQEVGPAPPTTWIVTKVSRHFARLARTRYNGSLDYTEWLPRDYVQVGGDWMRRDWPEGEAERVERTSVPK
jgi:hypothetical protein